VRLGYAPCDARRLPRMPRIVVEDAGGARSIDLAGDHVTIGRQADNLVALSDDVMVSRHHATLELRDGHWWIHDLGSHNGTTVDGRTVEGWRPLIEGSRIQIGSTELVLVDIAFDARATATRQPRVADESKLSGREREIVRLVAEGLTDEQIGEKLSVSPRTVRSNLDRIREKTGLRRRLELTRLAFELDLTEDLRVDPSHAELRTFLFTDLERHTEMLQLLGDVAGRAALRQHEQSAQSAIGRHGGVAIKGTGDGYLASFGSAQRALACAAELQRACAEHAVDGWGELKVRIGINAGEPIAEAGDLFGSSVNLAARITAVATGGQVLVSNVVKELVAGKAFRFLDRGETTLRGFDDPTRLWELDYDTTLPP
jgi:class 3 adenylate cyclase